MPKPRCRPNASKTSTASGAELRRALQRSVRPEHIEAIGRILIYKALRGDMTAMKELFDRLWGRPQPELENSDGGERPTIQMVFNRISEEEVARIQESRRLESQRDAK